MLQAVDIMKTMDGMAQAPAKRYSEKDTRKRRRQKLSI